MVVSSTRHFESSFAIVEWLLEERADELTDEQKIACRVYHDLLCETSKDLWGVEPPNLPEKTGTAPSKWDSEWWQDRQD